MPWNEARITSGLKVSFASALLQRGGERVDIDRLVEIGRRDAQRRLPAHARERVERLVADRRRGRGGILRIKRHDQDAVAAGCCMASSRDAIDGLP